MKTKKHALIYSFTGLLLLSSNLIHPNPEQQTPELHLAAQKGDSKVVQVLMDAGANIDTVDQHGDSALSWAVFFGQRRNSPIACGCRSQSQYSK